MDGRAFLNIPFIVSNYLCLLFYFATIGPIYLRLGYFQSLLLCHSYFVEGLWLIYLKTQLGSNLNGF